MRREERGRKAGEDLVLTIRLFGGMAITDERGADYLPRSRKTRAMVAVLAMTAPRPVQRSGLTALLWSRRENEQARASLRQAVHELQQTLGPAWDQILIAERHSLSLDPRDVSIDAVGASNPAAGKLELLTLFQGGFLEDLTGLDPAFDGWLEQERRRLSAAARAAGEAFLRGRHVNNEDMISGARAMLRIDRAHDGAWRALIQAHIEANDRAAARFACEQWAEAIGLAPDQALPAEMAAFLVRIRVGGGPIPSGRSVPFTPLAIPLVGPVPAGGRVTSKAAFGDIVPGERVPAGVSEHRVMPPFEWAGSDLRRTGLRLGVREMRIIGGNVDHALAEGLAEEITTALSRFRWISCVSGRSLAAMAGEHGEDNLRWSEIGLDLLLDGMIQRGGDRLRITVRLLDMRNGGAVVWANRFDPRDADPLIVQDGVAAAIVAQLDPVLLMREGELAASRGSLGAGARDLVLRAVPAIYRLDRNSFRAAGELLEAALRIEPMNIDALAWFAYWHLFLVGQGWADDAEAATSRAGTLADMAVAMDPNDARALTLAGHVRGFLMKCPAEAAVLHARAISLNPNLAIAWCFSGFALSYLGDQERALARMRQAILLSPSDPHLFFFQAAIIMPLLLRGEYHEAADSGLKAIELNPWFSSAFKGYLAVLGHLGRLQEASAVMVRLLKLEPSFNVRDAIRRSPMTQEADVERYAEGLRRAGLSEC
jgi:DNA-binding SARP family transcriptional activator/TolB-like protein